MVINQKCNIVILEERRKMKHIFNAFLLYLWNATTLYMITAWSKRLNILKSWSRFIKRIMKQGIMRHGYYRLEGIPWGSQVFIWTIFKIGLMCTNMILKIQWINFHFRLHAIVEPTQVLLNRIYIIGKGWRFNGRIYNLIFKFPNPSSPGGTQIRTGKGGKITNRK